MRLKVTTLCAALLGALTCTAALAQQRALRPVTDAMLQNPDPADWLSWRRTRNHWGYSPLTEVNKRNVQPERIKPLQEAFIQGWGGLPVVGTREQVVDTLATLSKAGLDGLLVAFPRYEEGLRDFRDKTYPLLKQAGLRDFV